MIHRKEQNLTVPPTEERIKRIKGTLKGHEKLFFQDRVN